MERNYVTVTLYVTVYVLYFTSTAAVNAYMFLLGTRVFLSEFYTTHVSASVLLLFNVDTYIDWLIDLTRRQFLSQEAQLSPRDRATRRVSWNLPIPTQQYRNYLYDKSWPNRWYKVGDLVGGNAWQTMRTQPWRHRVGFHCLKCHKQTDNVELCISPVCRRLAVAKFSKSTM